MAETTIPIYSPNALGNGQVITTAAISIANGNVVNNSSGNLIFHLKNTHATDNIIVTAVIIKDLEQNTTNKTLTLLAGEYGTMGPYKDNSTDGNLHFTATSGASGTGVIYAMRPKPPLY
jgi:hypothetical protein